jgi:4-hydroxythreonine-4-phosphate dehydrogenase
VRDQRTVSRILPLGIACGDPAGIGPEVILKALSVMGRGVIRGARIIGPRQLFEREQRRLGTKVDLSLVDNSVKAPGRFSYGRVQRNCGRAAFAALENGVELLRQGKVSALVTAPVSKAALRLAGFTWPGQTEFLAQRLGARRHAMLAWTPRFKAVFVTIHLPLARVARHITARLVFEKTTLLDRFLRGLSSGAASSSSRRPRLCVLAFNPHAAEFSRGEEQRIAAGVELCRKAGIDAVGPVPADAALASVTRPLGFLPPGSLPPSDAYVAMYHDQAMIPAKLLARGRGVNVTLGLDHVRTSPLHGTAFDIAGKGVAAADSMRTAILLARRLALRPTNHVVTARTAAPAYAP